MIELPDDFPINCFLCPLDPAEAAAEIKARFSASQLDALLKALKPKRSPSTAPGGLNKVKIIREGKDDLILLMDDRETNTDNLRFLGRRIALILDSWQYCDEARERKKASQTPG